MIPIDDNIKQQILDNTVNKEIVIHFPDGDIPDITSENIVSESMSLNRSIMNGKNFRFGGGISSQFKIKVINVESNIKGKKIEVSLKVTVRPFLYPSDNLYPSEDLFPCGDTKTYEYRLFTGKIDSALRLKNRNIKEIIAYDAFYSDSKEVYDFMQGFAQYSGTSDLKGLRRSVENILNCETEEVDIPDEYIYLSMTIENAKKAVKCNETTTTDVIRSCAELCGAFAVMNRYNNLEYLHPRDVGYPPEIIMYYYDLEWEEYETADITTIKFSYNSSDEKTYTYGYASETPSVYSSSDNIVTNCCSNISEFIKFLGTHYIFDDWCTYRPFKAVLFDYWWLEPGDEVRIITGAKDLYEFRSVVFNITLSGIQNMKTTIMAEGDQYLGKEEANAVY